MKKMPIRVNEFPEKLEKAVVEAEERLWAQILQHYDFESQIKQKELDGLVKLHNLQLTSFQGKIIPFSSQKADKIHCHPVIDLIFS